MFHPKAWGLWLLAALLPFSLTKNPYYLLIAIGAVGVVYLALRGHAATGRQWTAFLRIGLFLAGFSVVFNMLFVRAGATRLFTLPALRWQVSGGAQGATVIQIGGPVSLESLVYGLAQGLGLVGILLALATFNALVDHYRLLRSTPRFLYQSAVVTSIAVTFVPQLMAAQEEIREAQLLRGHRFRTLRDLPPLFVALLAEGLERSITLAESMSARGFGGDAGKEERSGLALKATIALALLVLVCGAVVSSYFRSGAAGTLLMAAGAGMLSAVVWTVGRGVNRSSYLRGTWTFADTALSAAAAAVILLLLAAQAWQRASLVFYPYPRLEAPGFAPVIGLSLLLLTAPVVVNRIMTAKETQND